MGNAIRVKQLETSKPLKWLSDGDPRGAGQLYARRNQSGRVIFYFRYTDPQGKRVQLPIGEWSETNDGELEGWPGFWKNVPNSDLTYCFI